MVVADPLEAAGVRPEVSFTGAALVADFISFVSASTLNAGSFELILI